MIETIIRRVRLKFSKIFHIKCSTNIIKLIIQEGFKLSNEYIGRFRHVLLRISASPKIKSYKQICK